MMRELTFGELDQVAGGSTIGLMIISPPMGGVLTVKALEYLWDNKGTYFNYLIKCSAQYGGGPFDYRLGS